jgi:CheY-like chemotaxis protein
VFQTDGLVNPICSIFVPSFPGQSIEIGQIAGPHSRVFDQRIESRRHSDTQPGEYVMLAVTDEGEGMNEAVKAHLFEPFFTTKEKGKGTGLGLSTVYGAVKQNRGSIEVCSEPGRGTTFKIYLPRIVDTPDRQDRPAEEAPAAGTETVVLVEDEEIVKTLAEKVLQRRGYTVHSFANGDEALAAIRRLPEPVHLLVTDVILPGVNGKVLAETVRSIRPEIKVLFTSGYTESIIAHHGVLDEGIEFIGKPYTPAALAKKVREVLDRPHRTALPI